MVFLHQPDNEKNILFSFNIKSAVLIFKNLNPKVIEPFFPHKPIIHQKDTELPIKNIYVYNVLKHFV